MINSPGGSPVQSHLIYRRIRELAAEKKLPVIAFAEDVAASGGYMIACAADEIICDPSSIVGSIGVVGGSFGFAKLMEKLGIERRLYTSGEHKAMLDPFLPEKPDDVERLKAVQREIHEGFIDLVKASRGAQLKGPETALFSGEYWTGSTAVELGLADGIGDLRATLRERFGDKVVTPLIAAERGWFGRVRPGVSGFDQLAARRGLAEDVISALEARAHVGALRTVRTSKETSMPPFIFSPLIKLGVRCARRRRDRSLGGERGAPHQRRPRPREAGARPSIRSRARRCRRCGAIPVPANGARPDGRSAAWPRSATFSASFALDALGADQRTPAGDFLLEVAGEFCRRLGEGVTPACVSLLRTSASLSAALRAALSLAITAGGVLRRRQDTGPLVGDGVGEALLHEGRDVREDVGAFLRRRRRAP